MTLGYRQSYLSLVRISDLRERIRLSFGEGSHFPADIALSELGSKTVNEALDAGVEADEIWRVVCKAHPLETEKCRY